MKTVIISRTDSIGDVVLTLPIAGVLKKFLPGCRVLFLGRSYTRPVIEASSNVDRFLNWDEIVTLSPGERAALLAKERADAIIHVFPVPEVMQAARKAAIPLRIGTTHRRQTWYWCNRLVFFSRRKSNLHEAQLNLKLLRPLGIKVNIPREEIPVYYGLPAELSHENQHPEIIILHPKSKGSAREWGLDNFSRLIGLMPEDRFRIMITGTSEEGMLMKDFLERNRDRVEDMTGKLTLEELIGLIRRCDALVAASTGPLHIAAALGKRAVGLYAPMRPIFPERWAPLGRKALALAVDRTGCADCRKSGDCHCIREITPEEVLAAILR